MKNKLKRFDEIISNIKQLEEEQYNILKDILYFKFPYGKYKDKTIFDIINVDFKYCNYWLKENYPSNSKNINEKFKLIFTLDGIKESTNRDKALKLESEYETKRAEYCKENNINYQLDYEIRHNRNLRDFGM